MADLTAGDRAPAFSAPVDGGGELSLSDLKGKKVVLYFYPKDDTPGCTKEAVEFSARLGAFQKAGAEVIGVSPDSVKKHDNFKAKHDLEVTLVADPDKDIANAYGVWVEKKLYGRVYMGVDRSTFLIDPKGVIQEVWRKVRVPGHVDAVLAAAKAL